MCLRYGLAFLTLFSGLPLIQAYQPDDALKKVPDWANALVMMNYQNILASPFAQREGWDKLAPMESLGTNLPYLKNTQSVIQAAHLEPGTLRSQRDLILVQGGPFPPMPELAKQEKGEEETLVDSPAILTPKNVFIISLSPNELAVCSPAHRQDTARWLRFAQSNKTLALSSYLQQAATAMNDGYHIVIALDMHEAIDPHLVRRFITHSPLLKGKTVDKEALVKVLTSSKGIRIGIRFDQTIKATLAADFSENIKDVANILPGLVLSALEDMGGELEEFPANTATIEEKHFLVSSTLTVKGLRKLLALVPPVSGQVLAPRDVALKGVPANTPLEANQKYFKTIRELANDANTSAEQKNDMILAAQAYERAAARIDQLAVGGIDEELVKFSTTASSKLRAIADALRSSVLEAIAVESGRKSSVTVTPGGYIGYSIGPWNPQFPGNPNYPSGAFYRPLIVPPQTTVRTNDAEIQAKQAEVLAVGAKKRLEIWRQLSDESANLRKKMSIKYKTDF